MKNLNTLLLKMLLTMGILISLLMNNAYSEDRIPIVVIDTGYKKDAPKKYLCSKWHLDLTNTSLNDFDGHGTNVAGIIGERMDASKYCIVIVKWYHNPKISYYTRIYKALELALKINAKIVNMSLSGNGPLSQERQAIFDLINNQIYVVVAAGNENVNLSNNCNTFPACYGFEYPYFRVVGNYNGNHKNRNSNYGSVITDKLNGEEVEGNGIIQTGTSQAAALLSAKLAK